MTKRVSAAPLVYAARRMAGSIEKDVTKRNFDRILLKQIDDLRLVVAQLYEKEKR